MKITVLQNLKQKFYDLGDRVREYKKLRRQCQNLRDVYLQKKQDVTRHCGNMMVDGVALDNTPACIRTGYTFVRNLDDLSKTEPFYIVSVCRHCGDMDNNVLVCDQTNCPCHAQNQQYVRAWQNYAAARQARRAFWLRAKTQTK